MWINTEAFCFGNFVDDFHMSLSMLSNLQNSMPIKTSHKDHTLFELTFFLANKHVLIIFLCCSYTQANILASMKIEDNFNLR